jgi:hypothetical protein
MSAGERHYCDFDAGISVNPPISAARDVGARAKSTLTKRSTSPMAAAARGRSPTNYRWSTTHRPQDKQGLRFGKSVTKFT